MNGANTKNGFPYNNEGGAWDSGTPKKVNVIVIHAGFGDATLLEVISEKGEISYSKLQFAATSIDLCLNLAKNIHKH